MALIRKPVPHLGKLREIFTHLCALLPRTLTGETAQASGYSLVCGNGRMRASYPHRCARGGAKLALRVMSETMCLCARAERCLARESLAHPRW